MLVAVDIRFARGRLYEERTVCHSFYTGVVERVDVHRHPACMLRELLRALHLPEVEAAGVVCPHGCLVVGIVFVDEHHPLDGVVRLVEFPEDVDKVAGNHPVADHLASARLPLAVHVKHPQIAQVGTCDGAALTVRLPPDTTEHRIGEGVGSKAPRHAELSDGIGRHLLSGFPLLQPLQRGVTFLLLLVLCRRRSAVARQQEGE